MLLRRVLRRFFNSKCFLEGFLEGACKGCSVKTRFLEGFLEGSVSYKALRRCLEGRNTSFRRVRPPSRAPYFSMRSDTQAVPAFHCTAPTVSYLWPTKTELSRKVSENRKIQIPGPKHFCDLSRKLPRHGNSDDLMSFKERVFNLLFL